MALIEVFYPGNQEKRENCVRLMQEIYSAMEMNFKETNKLIDILHKHMRIQCGALVFYKDKTLKENAENFSQKISEIQALLHKELQKQSDKIDPYIYEMLLSEKLELSKIYDYMRIGGKALDLVSQVIVFGVAIAKSVLHVLGKVVVKLSRLWLGTVILGVIALSVDAIYSAIVGAKERKMLESTESELQGVVDTFVPASQDYTREIIRLEMKIEMLQDA